MQTKNFTITGRIVDPNTNQGIPGFRLEVWDKDLFFDDLVGSAVSDAEGRFQIAFNEKHFKELIERRPDLYFKLFQEGQQVPPEEMELEVTLPNGTRLTGRGDMVFWQLMPGETLMGIRLAWPAGEDIYTVQGKVIEPDGTPIADAIVKAYDISLIPEGEDGKPAFRETLLGEATTNEKGEYQINYPASAFTELGKSAPDLDVRAFDVQGEKIAWLANPPLYNAHRREVVNLIRKAQPYKGPSDIHHQIEILKKAFPDLDKLAVLEPDTLGYLIRKTGMDARRAVELVRAARMANLTMLSPELFYALFRSGLPQTLPELMRQSPEVIRHALQEAIDRNLIPAMDVEEQTRILQTKFKELAVGMALQSPSEEGRLSLGLLLSKVLDEEEHRHHFLTVYAEHEGSIQEFWEQLKADSVLGDRVHELQLTLQLGALSLNHQPMLDKLHQMCRPAGEKIKPFAELAQYDEEDWQAIITTEGIGVPPEVPGEEDDEKIRNYARIISNMIEDSFPELFIANRLLKEDKEDAVGQFLLQNSDFNLKTTPISRYLRENEITIDNHTLSRLRAMQRVYRVAPRYRAMKVLLADGLDSALKISRLGKNLFIKRYESLLGAREVRCTYERAHQVHALVLDLLAKAGVLAPGVKMQVVNDEAIQEVEEIPDWQTLFKDSLELCDCQHCRSVLSPAAYFVDIINFLGDRMAADNERTARDILFERRPDLKTIHLTCENTNTPLPYVDLVNEILEDSVVQHEPFEVFEIDLSFESELNNHKISESLREVFADHHCPLQAENPGVIVGGEVQGRTPLEPWWEIDDLAFTYHIRKREGKLKVLYRGRQTRGSVRERAAVPQYINPEAYKTLRETMYPWTLPFDLDWETIRIYLGHLRTSRAEILETFLPGDRREILQRADQACEILGLTVEEAKIVTGDSEAVNEPWRLWGFSEPESGSIPDPADSIRWIDVTPDENWLKLLSGRVDVFLQQSGLSCLEMLDLLDTYFINPADGNSRKIRLVSRDPEHPDICETAQLALEGLDIDAAVHMVQFVRLWRHLGWSMRDLDLAITTFNGDEPTFGVNELNDTFLANLATIFRLQESLRLPVERLLPFWGNIGTAAYIDHAAQGQPRLPSLYEKTVSQPFSDQSSRTRIPSGS